MHNRHLLLCLAIFLFGFYQANAQETTVRFKIISQKSEPLSLATVVVVSVPDTIHKQTKITDANGEVSFQLLQSHPYLVKISSSSYQTVEKKLTITTDNPLFNITLQPASSTLSNVVVTTTRPLTRQEDDKTIVDPEPIAASSTNAYEILEKTPGVFVDQDGNVYLSSMSPAKIYINGREMKMSAADLASMLKNLPPNTISRIEILRTPSAKYDASGNGGIVNIVLRKGVKLGLTGSVVAGMQQGNYGNRFIGLNLNNNTGKKSSYLNLNYSRRNNFERIKTDRLFAVDSVLQQDATTKYPASNYFASYGISDSIGTKWFVDFAGSVTYQTFDNSTDNKNIIRKISTNEIISNSLNTVRYNGNYLRLSNGITFSRKIDSVSEWSNDFYYSYDRNRNNQQYNTSFYSPAILSTSGFGSPDNDRNYFTFTSDLRKKLRHRLTIETGVKASLLKFKSEAEYFKTTNSGSAKDMSRTNTFLYNENINAAYLQASKTFGRNVILKAGARVENTNMDGHQLIPFDTSFSLHRTDLFPYVYLSKKVMSIAGYELRSYLVARRTIVRPVYEQLNPFPRYVDLYLSEVGNPRLRPQFTNNYEANISVDERPLIAIGVNDTKDIFNQVVYTSDTSTKQSYRTYDNLGKNKEWYLRGMGAIPPGKRYFFVVMAQYNHNFYEGIYEGKPLSFKKGTWTLFTYHSLKLDKRSQFSLHGFIRLKGQQGFYELGSFGALNASINRQFLKQKLIVTMSAIDIFKTNKNEFEINQGSIHATGLRQGDTQRFGLNLRYNFGIRKKEESNNIFNIDSPEKGN
jgi:iron complex outermembrane recepter protein